MNPCPTLGRILRDQDLDDFYDTVPRKIAAYFAAVQSGTRNAWIAECISPNYSTDRIDDDIVGTILVLHLHKVVLLVAECSECGRLWVQSGPGINAWRSYAPDEPGYAGVLRSKPTAITG
jgi:hypothetical protein